MSGQSSASFPKFDFNLFKRDVNVEDEIEDGSSSELQEHGWFSHRRKIAKVENQL